MQDKNIIGLGLASFKHKLLSYIIHPQQIEYM